MPIKNNENACLAPSHKAGYGFGMFKGVFTPNILTILGVVMYLRFGWVLGNVGLFETLFIVTASTVITFLTAISISELATNARVKGGGAYYIISRSLGVEAGVSIGIPLYFAQALSVSFYVFGFSESLAGFFPGIPLNILAITTLFILTVVAYLSANLALKMQFVIMLFISASLISFFAGRPSADMMSISSAVSSAQESFWPVFAVFFPAVTGILAGLSMSGDLKNPEKSIPRGTFLAIFVSYAIYIAIPIFLTHLKIPKEALISDLFIMKSLARWPFFILLGLWGAALSSALGSMLGAPRTLQALSKDRALPAWAGKGFGKNNDPRIATILSFILAFAGILTGNLNAIASILTIFFLATYAFLNLVAALEGFLNNPSWRPKFRAHWGLSLAGALSCLMAMFMINAGASFITIFICAGVYYITKRRRLKESWGDIRYGVISLVIREALYRLAQHLPNEKAWRPNILVLSGSPSTRWYLIELADAIAHGKGFLTVAVVLPKDVEQDRVENMETSIHGYLKKRSVPAIVKVAGGKDIFEGSKELVKTYGFGPLVPNTVFLGETEKEQNFEEYAGLIASIYNIHKNVVIVREPDEKPLFKNELRIDIWWRREGENAGLMLALAFLLKTSPEWAGSRLIMRTVTETQEKRNEELRHLQMFIEQENLDIEVDVMVDSPVRIFDIMRERSAEASIVFLGMRPPNPGESIVEYSKYYAALIRQTERFPLTVLILTAEKIDFDAIFQLRA